MQKLLYLLLLCAFLFPACSLVDCSGSKKTPPEKASCSDTDSLPYPLAFFPAVTRTDTVTKITENIMIGGVANDSISVTNLSYKSAGGIYNAAPFPSLPKPLMNGFAFKLKDTIYYGGGYTINWKNAYIAPADTIFSIKYVSSSKGFVTSESGRIFSTTNAGVSWNGKKLNTGAALRSLDFFGGAAWTVTDSSSSKIFKTTNTGDAWDNGTIIGNARIKSIKFTSTNTGWAAGSEGKMFKTTNGGSSWDSVQRKTFNDLNSVSFAGQSFGWACGDGGRILKTTDAGIFWDTLKFTSNNLYSVYFKDSLTGYVVGANATLGKTTDGGANWAGIKIEASQTLRSVSISDSNTVVIGGDRGTVMTSRDGIKWERVYGLTPNNLNTISCIPGSNKTVTAGTHGFTSYANEGCFTYTISNSFYKRHRSNNDSAWIPCANLPVPLSEVFCSGGALNDSTGYVVGGKTTGNVYSDNIYRYSSKTGSWTVCSKLPRPKSYGGLAVVSDTMMLYLGGINSVNVTDTMYKISVKISSGQPDSLTITFSAKYPAGPIYSEGATGMKRRRQGVFGGGVDGANKFYPYIATTKFPFNIIILDTCEHFTRKNAPIIPAPSFTINWACPTAMDNFPEPNEPSSYTYSIAPMENGQGNTDNSSGGLEVSAGSSNVSYEFACCVCNQIRAQQNSGTIIVTNPDGSMQISSEIVDGCESKDAKRSLMIMMPGGVNENSVVTNRRSQFKP